MGRRWICLIRANMHFKALLQWCCLMRIGLFWSKPSFWAILIAFALLCACLMISYAKANLLTCPMHTTAHWCILTGTCTHMYAPYSQIYLHTLPTWTRCPNSFEALVLWSVCPIQCKIRARQRRGTFGTPNCDYSRLTPWCSSDGANENGQVELGCMCRARIPERHQ